MVCICFNGDKRPIFAAVLRDGIGNILLCAVNNGAPMDRSVQYAVFLDLHSGIECLFSYGSVKADSNAVYRCLCHIDIDIYFKAHCISIPAVDVLKPVVCDGVSVGSEYRHAVVCSHCGDSIRLCPCPSAVAEGYLAQLCAVGVAVSNSRNCRKSCIRCLFDANSTLRCAVLQEIRAVTAVYERECLFACADIAFYIFKLYLCAVIDIKAFCDIRAVTLQPERACALSVAAFYRNEIVHSVELYERADLEEQALAVNGSCLFVIIRKGELCFIGNRGSCALLEILEVGIICNAVFLVGSLVSPYIGIKAHRFKDISRCHIKGGKTLNAHSAVFIGVDILVVEAVGDSADIVDTHAALVGIFACKSYRACTVAVAYCAVVITNDTACKIA